MPFNTKKIKKDYNQQPVPQYFNKLADQYEVIEGQYGANRFVQLGTIREETWEGNTTIIKNFPSERFGFAMKNDGASDLKVTINGQTATVKAKEPYHAFLNPFTTVTITGNSAYRAEVFT